MKSYVVYKDRSRKIVDGMPMPKYGDYDALVKIESCGVCRGTDTKIIHGDFKGIEKYPVVLGHEGVGRVTAIGKKVTNYKVGDLVLMPYWSDVPEGYESGWGTYSEYNIVTDALAMEHDGLVAPEWAYAQKTLPADFDPVSSAMIITFREVWCTMKNFGFEPNKSLVILGLGPVGLSFVKFAKLSGMGPIIAVDLDDKKLELAKKFGADHIINGKNADLVKEVRSILPNGVDYALDAVGVSSFINTALQIIKDDAKICVYGISANKTQLVDWTLSPHNWQLHFHQFPSKLDESAAHSQIVSWIQLGIIDPNDFISHVYDFADIDKAFDDIENGVQTLKQVIRF